MNILLIVMDFASHRTWAEGYQRASLAHDVDVVYVSGDRWKWRMLTGALDTLLPRIEGIRTYEVIVVDGMLDVTPLCACLRSNETKVLMFLHENQITTPFSPKDRDVTNNTHWHYGFSHVRSFLAVDGVLFNSDTHLNSMREALPRLIRQQCPTDCRDWYLRQMNEVLEAKSRVLYYGLDLDGLWGTDVVKDNAVLLWNARLEADKDPDVFLDILDRLKKRNAAFKLIVLGKDTSKDQIYATRLQRHFTDKLLFFGWCTDRQEYAKYIRLASIVISTARHETFGISVVESVFAGCVPLLPRKLSYPELFPPNTFPQCFYRSPGEAVQRLMEMLELRASNENAWTALVEQCQAAVERFRWPHTTRVYDSLFCQIHEGIPLNEVVVEEINEQVGEEPSAKRSKSLSFVRVDDPSDARIQLYRSKSIRHHRDYHEQLQRFRKEGVDPVVHGGRRAVKRMLEAMVAGAQIEPLSFLTTPQLASEIFSNEICPIFTADKATLDAIRGQKLNAGDAVLALLHFPISQSLEKVIQKPPIMVLDNVRNSENIGSILRTAFCLGVTSIVTSKTTWRALDGRAARVSMGTMYFHDFHLSDSLVKSIRQMKEVGISTYAIEIGSEARPIAPHGSDKNFAMILGNEDKGMSEELLKECDEVRFIPQAHGDSLNVGHAASISLYTLVAECGFASHDGKACCK